MPDLASRTVMTCGPAPYMEKVEQDVAALGVTRFFKENSSPRWLRPPPAG
nr:NADH oxidoreductase hcr [Klebsiella pneumoniae]